jgi:hypothetical protein
MDTSVLAITLFLLGLTFFALLALRFGVDTNTPSHDRPDWW